MKPGIIYRVNFQNFDNDYVRIDIADTSVQIDDDADPDIRLMTGTGDPLHIRVIDNAEEKYTTIRAKQAVIQIRSDINYNISTFADGPDKRFQVACRLNPSTVNLPIFDGYLVTSDLEQLFLPNPQVVVLTASDHIGLLKDVSLPVEKGKHKISHYLAECLKQTTLRLPLKVINNKRVGGGAVTLNAVFLGAQRTIISEQTNFFYPGQKITVTGSVLNNGTYTVVGTGIIVGTAVVVAENIVNEESKPITFQDVSSLGHIYDTVYLDSLTFEQEIGTLENCYDVLGKILQDGEFLTEYNGAWWICSVDEYEGGQVYVANFDPDGVFIDIVETDISRLVGAAEVVKFADADNLLRLDRPKAFINETFRYEFPQELVCNMDFQRGDYVSDLPSVTVDNIAYSAKRYTLECWEYAKHRARGLSSLPADSIGYVKKLYYNDQERDRYLRMEAYTPTNPTNVRASFKSEALQVNKDDKIIASTSVRWSNFNNGSSPFFLGVELQGTDGSYWYGYSPIPFTGKFTWFNYGVSGLDDLVMMQGPAKTSDDDFTQWQSYTVESAPIPTGGNLFFYHYFQVAGYDINTYKEVSDFSVEYLPFINGSYRQYSGQAYSVRRDEQGYSANREQEVYISNAPITVLKGAMFVQSLGGYWLTPRYYPAHLYGLGNPPDQSRVNTYGYLQALAVWNQNRNTVRKFSGTLLHLGENWPDIVHKFRLTDTNANTVNRYFLLLSFDQDWKSCKTSANFIEVYHTDGKVYTDPWSFKYVTQ